MNAQSRSPGRRFEALVVDFGGVLTSPLPAAMAAFAARLGIDFADLARAALGAYAGLEDDLVTGFETGRITEREFSERFARRLSEISGRRVEPDGLVGRMFSELVLEESMFDLVRRAREAGYRTGLCSNSWSLDLYPRQRLEELFDATVISGEVGLRKPDPEIFKLTAARLGVSPARCVFVDDHPGHLKAAAGVGMTTVLHRDPRRSAAEVADLLELAPADGPSSGS